MIAERMARNPQATANSQPSRLAPPTIARAMLEGYSELLRELGRDPEAIMLSVGINPAGLADQDAKVDFRTLVKLLELSAVAGNCPDLGMRLAQRQSGPTVMGPLGEMIRSAPTYGDVLSCSATYMQAFTSAMQIRLELHPERAQPLMRLEFLAGAPRQRRQIVEQILLIAVRDAPVLSGGEVRVREVWFAHDRLASAATYRSAYGAPVHFGQRYDAVLYRSEDIAAPNAAYDPLVFHDETAAAAERFPAAAVELAGKVRMLIVGSAIHGARCTHAQVAAALGMHERSLRRRLRATGISFERIRDQVIRDIAVRYFERPELTLSMISERLGFAEPAVLSRACRRWFGRSPRSIRRDLLRERDTRR